MCDCASCWKTFAKPYTIQSRLFVVVPQKPPVEAEQQQKQEKQKSRWSIFGRPIFPADMFPQSTIIKKGNDAMEEVANFFSSARYGIAKEEEEKEKQELEVKEVETKVSGIMKDME